jgi:Tfp pilus assembly protein PilX
VIASVSFVLGLVVGFLIVLLILLFIGGLIATGRRRQALRGRLAARIEEADAALAQARASDRGWEREVIEAAARAAFAARHGGKAPDDLQLVQVVDKPGTDADQAVFRAVVDLGRDDTITLGRRDGAWVAL